MAIEHDELAFEERLIKYLTQLGGTKQWDYRPEIKTTADLWENFRRIVYQLNPDKLDQPLSASEFSQVQRELIRQTKTPYLAGQFLYGYDGVSQLEIDRDDGKHVHLTIFDQREVGAGRTVYQVVSQIERPAVIPGRKPRRFDTTLLINGLPIIQIEEKADGHDVSEALNQMQQYVDERQFSDIYGLVQVLVAMTPHDTRYLATPATAAQFNLDFAFRWQDRETNDPVLLWQQFANQVLSIPMAHMLVTNYMILDGTAGKEMLKVMRPYQVYATQAVLEKVKEHNFDYDDQRLGYVWHTTGSGKTISSFKAAWLAAREPNVDKVIFLVDRIALTNQTMEKYRAYDPDSTPESLGEVVDTKNQYELQKKLLAKDTRRIVVTSTQKMAALVNRLAEKQSRDLARIAKQQLVFIVDEAHRSTGGDMLASIKHALPHSAWVGYTGTPTFADEKQDDKGELVQGTTTRAIFGDPLHIYTIKNAIADGNVLQFKVDFETTLSEKELREHYLPEYFKQVNPAKYENDPAALKERIKNLRAEDMDDMVAPSVYDENAEHVRLVVKDVLEKWEKRSNHRQFNALFTTHVGGNRASTPMAMMYYREFKRQNAQLAHPLKIAITFSQQTNNHRGQLDTNRGLREAMDDYNAMFGTHFGDDQVKEYTAQVVSRLDRTINDDRPQADRYLDLVIVVDQLLTGFDAPQLNTLYVDRTLKGAGLIQAYSRTNRVFDSEAKPYGRIVNYRWPHHSEKEMKKALATYANRMSAAAQTRLPGTNPQPGGDPGEGNGVDGITPPDFGKTKQELKAVVDDLRKLTDDFKRTPDDQEKLTEMTKKVHQYNHLMAMATQDDKYDDKHPATFLKEIGLNEDKEEVLTTVLVNDLKRKLAKHHGVDVSEIKLSMSHVKEVMVNYDYLRELISQLLNQHHEGQLEAAKQTAAKIHSFTARLENTGYADKVNHFTDAVLAGEVTAESYPVHQDQVEGLLDQDAQKAMRTEIQQYKAKWGLLAIDHSELVNEVLYHHQPGADDLNNHDEITQIVKEAQRVYSTDATDPEIRDYKKMRYRREFRQAFPAFADHIAKKY